MIIDFNRYNGGGGSGSGVTPQEVQAQIDSALTYYWESGETKDYVDGAVSGISFDGYYTSGETDEAIAQAVAPFYTSGQTDEKISQAVAPFYTSAQTDEVIAQAVSGLATEQYVQDALSGVNLENYWTSAETEEAIVSKNYVTSAQVETQIEAKNYVNSGDVKSQVEAYNYATVSQIPTVPTSNTAFTNDAGYITDAAIENLVTSAQVKTQIEGYNYVTSGEVETQITNKNYITDQALTAYTPTSGFATVNGSAITNGGNLVIQGGGGGDMSAYWTSAQTQSAITSVSGNLQTQIDTIDTVASDALNDLNGRFNLLSASTVTSQEIRSIVKIEQSDYDTLVAQSATSQTTLYMVVPDAQ